MDIDKYGRIVAIIRMQLPDGTWLDLCDWMVREGYAVAYR